MNHNREQPTVGRPLAQLLAVGGACVLFTSGCASHAQTAPVYRQSAPAGSTEVAVREEFDPARFRQDLLLIKPVFTPPSVAAPVSQPTAAPSGGDLAAEPPAASSIPGTPGGSTGNSVGVPIFRVQVIALSNSEGANRIADELRRRFDVPAEVLPQGRLFAVRAGEARTSADAESLRAQIAALSRGYEGAFLVTDTLRVTTTAADANLDGPVAVVDPMAESDGPPILQPPVSQAPGSQTPDPDTMASDVGGDDPAQVPELVLVQGWRVLIGQFMNLADAQDYRGQVMKRLRRDDVDVKFEAPWYKVLAGGYRTSTAAQQFVERCRSLGFRNAALVRAEVYLSKEESNR